MAHEDLSREHHVEGSSDRAFGLVFSGVFLAIAGWRLFHLTMLRRLAVEPYGMLLVTGPTGNGETTLAEINRVTLVEQI